MGRKFKNMTRFVSIIALVTTFLMTISPKSFAQDGDIDGLVDDTKNDLLIVVGGGLAGAVLGLSTLSFVEEPKEHTRNIIVGASIGIIAGVGYVAFSQATKSQQMIYGEGTQEASSTFSTKDRRNWHASNNITQPIVTPYNVSMSFRF